MNFRERFTQKAIPFSVAKVLQNHIPFEAAPSQNGDPPLEFINRQPKKGGPPLDFIKQMGTKNKKIPSMPKKSS